MKGLKKITANTSKIPEYRKCSPQLFPMHLHPSALSVRFSTLFPPHCLRIYLKNQALTQILQLGLFILIISIFILLPFFPPPFSYVRASPLPRFPPHLWQAQAWRWVSSFTWVLYPFFCPVCPRKSQSDRNRCRTHPFPNCWLGSLPGPTPRQPIADSLQNSFGICPKKGLSFPCLESAPSSSFHVSDERPSS